MKSAHHQHAGRIGGLTTQSRIVDRSAATAKARGCGPASIEWHAARLGPEFDHATDQQREAAAEAARKLWYARLAMKSAKARRRAA